MILRIITGLVVLLLLALASVAVGISHNSACVAAPSAAVSQPMRAAVHRCYGTPAVVHIEPLAQPVPADHGVLVRVHATSINPYDWHMMRGEPYIMRLSSGWGTPNDISLGTDFSGTVEAVGKLVTLFKPGDEVFGAGGGAFAQYLRVGRTPLYS